MRYAEVENGKVVQVIVAEPDVIADPEFAGQRVFIDAEESPCGPGWGYDGTAFTPPPRAPEPAVDPIDQAMEQPAYRALVRRQARAEAKTIKQVVDELKAEV